jgi:hypothetical protein
VAWVLYALVVEWRKRVGSRGVDVGAATMRGRELSWV